jgi:hypothetical protein
LIDAVLLFNVHALSIVALVCRFLMSLMGSEMSSRVTSFVRKSRTIPDEVAGNEPLSFLFASQSYLCHELIRT